MPQNPYEQSYPEGVFKDITLQISFDPDTKNYMVYCPEWKSELPAGANPVDTVAKLLDEIVNHNTDAVQGSVQILARIVESHLRQADVHPYDERIVAAKKALQDCMNGLYTLTHESVTGRQRQALKRTLSKLIEATVEVDQLVRVFSPRG